MSLSHNREPYKSETPTAAGAGINVNTLSGNYSTGGNILALLSRLKRVRKSGRGHIACCPAHPDKTASLSVCASSDGTILLKCFAGCGAGEIVAALGLKLGDLFPTKPRDCSPEGRNQMRQFAKESQWLAALHVLSFEAGVVLLGGSDLLAGKHTPANQERLTLACERINGARVVLS